MTLNIISNKEDNINLSVDDSHFFGCTFGIDLNGADGSIITDNIIGDGSTNQTNVFALWCSNAGKYNQFAHNNLSGITSPNGAGAAYTTSGGSTATLPGSPTTAAAFGTGGICGFNVV